MKDENSNKASLRAHYQGMRNALSLSTLTASSAAVCKKINALQEYNEAKHIAIYHAVNGEINLSLLLNDTQKIYYFPVINEDRTLAFLPVTPTTSFYKNRFGIAEPDVSLVQAIPPKQLDIICLPLVAFDEYGNRLGMGGGYYDRTLAQPHQALLIGVGHEFQHACALTPQPWDIPLDMIVTEHNIYRSKTCPIIG